jgi:DNA (cytosine-5)-methyltransferase 1
MSNEYVSKLKEAYDRALTGSNLNDLTSDSSFVDDRVLNHLDTLADRVETSSAVMNVTLTSLLKKTVSPDQDIRNHQSKMENGYSGRVLDTNVVTPFLKSKGLKTMQEAGWLTRSLEQNAPYNLSYPGAIRNTNVKKSFLYILDKIQNDNVNPFDSLVYLLQRLILLREESTAIINPLDVRETYPISDVIDIVRRHHEGTKGQGRSKIPVLAIYSIYECMITQLSRYSDKKLVPLGSHTSPDSRSRSIGDIQVNADEGYPYEGVEIKSDKEITKQMVKDAYEKFKEYKLNRYYLLSNKASSSEAFVEINEAIAEIAEEHGCQVIVNGLFQTIKYYLRLLNDPDDFLIKYASNVTSDSEITLEHKNILRKLLEEYSK